MSEISKIRRPRTNRARGDTGYYYRSFDIFRDRRTRCNRRSTAESHARQYNCPSPNKHIIFNDDASLTPLTMRGPQIVVRCQNADFGRDRHVVTDYKSAAVVESAALVNDAIASHYKVSTRIEPCFHEDAAPFADLEPHNVSVVPPANRVAREARDEAVRQEHQSVKSKSPHQPANAQHGVLARSTAISSQNR